MIMKDRKKVEKKIMKEIITENEGCIFLIV